MIQRRTPCLSKAVQLPRPFVVDKLSAQLGGGIEVLHLVAHTSFTSALPHGEVLCDIESKR
jgi:hypothetical protein